MKYKKISLAKITMRREMMNSALCTHTLAFKIQLRFLFIELIITIPNLIKHRKFFFNNLILPNFLTTSYGG